MLTAISLFDFSNSYEKYKSQDNSQDKEKREVYDGKIFEGDGDLMLRNTYSIDSKIEMARKYWSGETQSNNQEMLFVGCAEVVEIR